jgi:glycosyltransferase involved in cell wall biosynthesis
LERAYGGPREGLLRATISLTKSDEIVDACPDADGAGIAQLLTVGRIEPEKNPLLLVDALAELDRRRPGAYRLTWAGTGRMAGMVRARAAALGVAGRLELAGFVPYGPELLAIYRGAHIFVHVSLTEGAPQVIIEAMASGVPVVATDVGSVRELLDEGRAGLIVPAGDRDALVEAVLELSDHRGRRQYVERGLVLARRYARDVEAARVARFIAASRTGADSRP